MDFPTGPINRDTLFVFCLDANGFLTEQTSDMLEEFTTRDLSLRSGEASDLLAVCETYLDHLETPESHHDPYSMNASTHRALKGTLKSLYDRLARHRRQLCYVIEGLDFWDLPAGVDTHLANRDEARMRLRAAERIEWLTANYNFGENVLYPPEGTARYGQRASRRQAVIHPNQIPANVHFLLTGPPPLVTLEWRVFLSLVEILTDYEMTVDRRLRRRLGDLQAAGLTSQSELTLDNTTVPATAEALAAGETNCSICMNPYSDAPGVDSNGEPHQPAHRTLVCNHYHCRACYEQWLHSGSNNARLCPLCRTFLLPVQGPQWPESLIPELNEYHQRFLLNRDLDRRLDTFLMSMTADDMTVLHDSEFRDLLYDLQARVHELNTWRNRFDVALATMMFGQ